MVPRVIQTLSARLATPFRWLLLAGIAYTLANSLMYLLAGPTGGAAPTASAPTGATAGMAAGKAAVDIAPLLARNLFGAADGRPAPVATNAPVAVATQLPLELRGVFVAERGGTSAAIIAQRGRPGMLYNVGQDIAGSAVLEDVRPDHVILRRAGVSETLHFPKAGQGWTSPAPMPAPMQEPMSDLMPEVPYDDPALEPAPYDAYEEPPMEQIDEPPLDDAAAVPADSGTNPADLVADYRERLTSNPDEALQSLGMSPVSAGSASGYRIDNLAQSPYLSQTGLQPGDVILSVNGRPVGDLNQDRLEIDNVLAQGSARIEVQRGARRFFVTASLP